MNTITPIMPEGAFDPTVTQPMQLYFRHRQNGALVFRIEVANRQRRIELNQIASITKHGDIVPHRRHPPTEAETAEITAWWQSWKAREDSGDLTDTEKFVVDLNRFADWITRKADAEEVDARSDDVLMAILDLRQAIVRRLSNIAKAEERASEEDALAQVEETAPSDDPVEEPPRHTAKG